jgi:nicotinate phosphoribosyltransferase
LREQLEATRKLRFHKSELIWLAGNTFYGKRGIFEPAFLEWLERDFRLSDYDLSVQDGQLSLRFHGLWAETTMWEIYALSAIDELKTRASLKRLSELELDIVCAGHDPAVGKDGAAARGSAVERKRLWHAAQAQLPVA